jgi:hypothetical protein
MAGHSLTYLGYSLAVTVVQWLLPLASIKLLWDCLLVGAVIKFCFSYGWWSFTADS